MENNEEKTGTDTDLLVESDETISLSKKDYDKLNQTLGSLKRELKDLKKPKEDAQPEKREQKLGKLDYGQKAFLIAKGYKDEDFDFVENQISESGLGLDTLLGNKYFKAAYEDRKTAGEIQDAMPESSKRTSSASRSTVDYWLKKGSLPPKSPETMKLRRDIVKARINLEKGASKFADVSVIG